MIPKILELSARADLRTYTIKVNYHAKLLPIKQQRLVELDRKILELKKQGGIIPKLKLYMIFIGLERQRNELNADVTLYSRKLAEWRFKKEQAETILAQVKREHSWSDK